MKPVFFPFLILLILAACAPAPSPSPSVTSTLEATSSATATRLPTRTRTPTQTFTPTATYTPTLTPTPTETPAPLAPATLFSFHDANGRTVDWGYSQVSFYEKREDGSPRLLSGFLAFQLMDRAIHHATIDFDGQTLTIYYLNVQHEFSGQMMPVQLILSAASGQDVPLSLIPAGGSAYVRSRLVARWDIFDAYSYHRDANKVYSDRSRRYPDVLLTDLQTLLPTLPDKLIVLADAPVMFDPDTFGYQLKYEIDTVPFAAARNMPFLSLDDYGRITGPNPAASALADLFINRIPLSEGIPYYSSDTLIFVLDSGIVPTVQ